MALWWMQKRFINQTMQTFEKNIYQIGFLKSKPGTLRQNFPKLFTDDFTDKFNWDGIGKNKIAIRHRVFISHILYGLCLFQYFFMEQNSVSKFISNTLQLLEFCLEEYLSLGMLYQSFFSTEIKLSIRSFHFDLTI